MVLGHDLSAGHRTQDIRISEDVSFDTMLLEKETLKGLKKAGFLRPSPIQLHGIPLGKCGFDLLLEAKSGTGKTAVFTVISLEKLDLNKGVQTIILAPTREIASQISGVITEIGSQYKGLNVAVVMGGLSYQEDIEKFKENIHILVGSPGRLRHLIQNKHIDISAVRLFVLDEADKLMEKSFLPDINYIFSLLPKQKQVIMSSATYTEESKQFTSKYVQMAQHVCPDSNNVLLGIAQKVVIVPHNSNIVKQTKHRYTELKNILNSKQFKQCLIFCNYQVRVGELHKMLSRDKWPAEQLYGHQDQTDRLDALKTLQEYKCRILVSTDLAARGIDASNVDIVINFEPPFEWQTYLHRIGRAGRYGSYGTAISILSEGKEMTKFKKTLELSKIPFNLHNLWNDEPFNLSDDTLEKDEALFPIPSNNTPLQNGEKTQDILWKALTTEPLDQNVIQPEITSFNDLCNSFKMSSERNVESFSDLMLSFKIDQNKISDSKENIEFKHVKVAEIPMNVKFWDNVNTTNQESSFPNVDNLTHTNGNSVNEKEFNENERYLTEEMEKERLTTTFGAIKKTHCRIQKYHDSDSDSNSSKTEISSIKQPVVYADFPTAFRKQEQDEGHSSHYNHSYNNNIEINTGVTETESNEILVDATVVEKSNHRVTYRYHDSDHYYNRTTHYTEIDPTKQALIEAGLPTAFGKNKQNQNRIHTYYRSNDNNETIPKDSKVRQHQQTSKTQEKTGKNIYSCKTFTRESNKQKSLSAKDTESETSTDSSSESSCNKKSSKSKNDYARNYSKTSSHQSKKHHNTEQNKGKQFDAWYEQLKRQTQSIQYALYIEEMRNF